MVVHADKPSPLGVPAAPDDADALIAAIEALNDGHTLGDYELLLPIGRGGMAVVWCARLRGTRGFSKTVAVKTMLPALTASPRFERMLLQEADIASRIHHPNVCEILYLGEERGILYLVMERVDGDSLAALLAAMGRDRQVPHGVAAQIGAQAARGLHAAHEIRGDDGSPYGLVHRDVSPQNILVTWDGLVKIVDFGIAKAALRTEPATSSGIIKGKAAYLAPEQVQGEAVDARTDVFSLGVVLLEMTTGANPLRAASDLATLLAISSPDPVTLPADPAYPAGLRRVLGRALAKDPDERHPSMHALAAELDAVATELGATPEGVAACVREALGERRRLRNEEVRAAIERADARSDHRSAQRPAERPPAPSSSRRQGGRSLVPIAIVGLAGAVVGALGLRASQGAAPAREPAAPTATGALGEDRALEPPAPAPAPRAESAAAETTSQASRADAPTVGSAATSAPAPSGPRAPATGTRPTRRDEPAASAVPTVPVSSAAAPADSGPRDAFRRPGF